MNKLKTIEDFFVYTFTQAKTLQQRIAILFIQQGYMLPNYLSQLTWKDIDIINNRFWPINYLGRFPVEMSNELRQKIKIYNIDKEELLFKKDDELNSLIQKLTIALEENPILLEQFNRLFVNCPYPIKNRLFRLKN